MHRVFFNVVSLLLFLYFTLWNLFSWIFIMFFSVYQNFFYPTLIYKAFLLFYFSSPCHLLKFLLISFECHKKVYYFTIPSQFSCCKLKPNLFSCVCLGLFIASCLCNKNKLKLITTVVINSVDSNSHRA